MSEDKLWEAIAIGFLTCYSPIGFGVFVVLVIMVMEWQMRNEPFIDEISAHVDGYEQWVGATPSRVKPAN